MTIAPAIRDASTLILLRGEGANTRVLMGQRGAKAAFMPNKFVFPGGALDQADRDFAPAVSMPAPLAARLGAEAPPYLATPLALAAVRELWEETGLRLAMPSDPRPGPVPDAWQGFCRDGFAPALGALSFIFRAVTPPGRPRRFDARFFVARAEALASDPDDFSGADAELSHLHWIDLQAARDLELPFITEVVLSELEARLADSRPDRPVPYFHHDAHRSHFSLL
ncbi:NUDIX hydrolase [Oceanomicrobium pacificus]|uniref:DNA mismatch repair protein MutT n=1 Tax=Oceanomicrobium pacificus TaxID=2692916 RepID=A0A6B0TPR1_9RHOB|nr:NUDIX hydrolase [Oceanomicrobium pacificus]MXU63838.1 DNA mismatch repair protein MutT [Oceanomicrobium pacificus]